MKLSKLLLLSAAVGGVVSSAHAQGIGLRSDFDPWFAIFRQITFVLPAVAAAGLAISGGVIVAKKIIAYFRKST